MPGNAATMLIPFNDYVRTYRVIRSVLESYPDTNLHKACIAFAVGGMHILRENYHLNATVSVGGAAYILGTDDTDALGFGRNEGGEFKSDRKAFHCWVQAGDWFIDFMAPLFPEIMRREGRQTKSVPKMFQRRREDMRHHSDLEKPGDFSYDSFDPDTAEDILQESLLQPAYRDMWETMVRWHVRCPKKIKSSVQLFDQRTNGKITLQLSSAPVDGTL